MRKTIKSLATAGAIFILSGCGESLFQGAPDEIDISINEGQTKAIAVSGGEFESSYSWSVSSGSQVLSISEDSSGVGLSNIETESSVIYIISEQVDADVLLSVEAVELTTLGDSKIHKFNVSVLNVEPLSKSIDVDENSVIEASVEYDNRENLFSWDQVSGPSLTITENLSVASITIPKVQSDSNAVVTVKETNDDGYFKETTITINIKDVPTESYVVTGVSGDTIKISYPNALDDSTYEWSLLSGDDIAISSTASVVEFLLPDVQQLSQRTIVAQQTDVNGIVKTVQFELEISPKETNNMFFEFSSEETEVVIVIPGNVESEYIWTQILGPTIDLSETNTLRAILDMPLVKEDTQATFLVKETDPEGIVTRTSLTITITAEENTGSTVLSMTFSTGEVYPNNTNVIPRVALADDGFSISAYQIKYTNGLGINAVVKNINEDDDWIGGGTELTEVDEVISMSVDVAENNEGIIAYISKTNEKTSLNYIRYKNNAWSQPVAISTEEEYAGESLSVSINSSGNAVISYVKSSDNGSVGDHYISTISPFGSVSSKNMGTSGSLSQSDYESEVAAINTKNSDKSIKYTLAEDLILSSQEPSFGGSSVFIDSVGKVYLTYQSIETKTIVNIIDPTVNQDSSADDLYLTETSVELDYTTTEEEQYVLKSSVINGSSIGTKTLSESSSPIGFHASGTKSGKYAVVFDTESKFGLKDAELITYNTISKSQWSVVKSTESFDDKSFYSSKVALNESGDVVTTSTYKGVNDEDEGHQISFFDAKNEYEITSFFVDDADSIEGFASITIDPFGNTLFSYVGESNILLQTYSEITRASPRVDIEIDNTENAIWDGNKNGELVVVHYSDVDSGYVHTKQD